MDRLRRQGKGDTMERKKTELRDGEWLRAETTRIRRMDIYMPLAEIFFLFREEDQAVFLDSSLENKLGRYSIIGRRPYLTLRKESGQLFINGEWSDQAFETVLKTYLEEHQEENPTHLPMISGAIGYFTYDYGRRRAGVDSRFEEQETDLIPEAVWNFYDQYLVEDHKERVIYLIAGGKTEPAEAGIRELKEQIRKHYRERERVPDNYV